MEVGDRLNPHRSYRKGFALKGLHQHIIKTNNPSTIGPGELLTIRFPDLKENQVIIPETTKLTFNITLVAVLTVTVHSSFVPTFDFFKKYVAFCTGFNLLTLIFMLPYIIMDLPIFVIAEWATLLVDIRCPRGGS